MQQENQLKVVNKKGCHAELVSASSTHVVSQRQQQRRAWKTPNHYYRTPYYNLTGRGQAVRAAGWGDNSLFNNSNNGFTLIELLVVVLIIGILAAVALPQYQKAVDKTHMMAGITLLDSLHKAQESYYLSHGSYAARMEELDIDFPPRGCVISGNFNNAFFCPQHSIYVYNTTNSPTQESNPGGIGILYCPGETVAENCATNKNGAQWYIEHHVLEEYRNRIICGSQPRAQMLCTYVKKLANK